MTSISKHNASLFLLANCADSKCSKWTLTWLMSKRMKTSSYNYCLINDKKPMIIYLYIKNIIFTFFVIFSQCHSKSSHVPLRTTDVCYHHRITLQVNHDQLLSDITLICQCRFKVSWSKNSFARKCLECTHTHTHSHFYTLTHYIGVS